MDEDVILAMRRARRKKLARPSQALGITAERRDQLMKVCSDDLAGPRDKVLVAGGLDSLCRRSELVALRVEDFTLEANDTYTVLVRRAKNDQFVEGRTQGFHLVQASWLKNGLTRQILTMAPSSARFIKEKSARDICTPSFVGATLKRLSKRTGYSDPEVQSVSGHPLRVGAAQTLTVMGYGPLPIMSAGGWRSSNVVARHVEKVEMNVWER